MTSNTQSLEPGDDFDEAQADALVAKADQRGYLIARPDNVRQIKLIRQALHKIISGRLIEARNKSGLNNDKINRIMLDRYMMRRRGGKAWTFTNALNPRTCYFPDAEEVDMLSDILKVDPETLGIHHRLAPWIFIDQTAAREKRKRKTPRTARLTKPAQSKKILGSSKRTATIMSGSSIDKVIGHPDRAERAVMPTALRSDIVPEHKSTPQTGRPITSMRNLPTTAAKPQTVTRGNSMSAPTYAGDVKITHSGAHLHVHGKIWCDQVTAQKLRMIVPLKLLQQARHDDPWSYEINGPVHAYQLYNLMHVLYGTPRVTAVHLD